MDQHKMGTMSVQELALFPVNRPKSNQPRINLKKNMLLGIRTLTAHTAPTRRGKDIKVVHCTTLQAFFHPANSCKSLLQGPEKKPYRIPLKSKIF